MQKAAPGDRCGLQESGGAAYWNRTSDPQLRRLLLYPTELTPHAYLDLLSSSYKCSGSDAVSVSIRKIHFRRLHNSRLLCPLFGGADLCSGSYTVALCCLQRCVARLFGGGLPAAVVRHVVRHFVCRLGAKMAEPKGWHVGGKLLVCCFHGSGLQLMREPFQSIAAGCTPLRTTRSGALVVRLQKRQSPHWRAYVLMSCES